MANKILQITHKPPFPKIDGGCLEIAKMSNYYDSSEEFELDIFSLSTYKHPFVEKEFKKSLTKKTNLFSVKANTRPSFFGALKAFFSGKSYNLSRFVNNVTIEKLIKLVHENKYDFIQFESIYAAQFVSFIKPLSQAKLVLNTPNVEYNLWKQNASKASFLKKLYFNSLSKKLEKREIFIWRQMDGIICISNEIENVIEKKNINTPTLVLPFKLNIEEYIGSKTNNNSPSFFHIGAMDWKPNKEGVNWFLNSVWKPISGEKTLHLAGKGINKEEFNDLSSIYIHGFVDDSKEFMNSHDIMVVPLLTGSGMRIKIIEAMALGKCVISTTKGAEGINYTDKKNIWIANTPEDFTTTINQFINEPNLAEQIGLAARVLVEQEYNSSNLDDSLIPFFNLLK